MYICMYVTDRKSEDAVHKVVKKEKEQMLLVQHWLRSFSNLDPSRSIRAKCSAFLIKSRSALKHLRKSDLAMPICAAGRC